MTNIYNIPTEVEKALENYYACFNEETGELISSQEEMEACQAILDELKNQSDDIIKWYLEDRANRKARVDMLKSEVERLAKLVNSEEKKIGRAENLIGRVFERVYEGKPINIGTFVVSYRKSEAVVIEDETRIPSEFMKTPEPPAPRPDKTAIKEAIKGGTEIPGASIETRSNLQIK
jgi:hypothetical protein